MISEKKQDAGSKLSSWKVYYAVLSAGFLLLYKEGHVRSKVMENNIYIKQKSLKKKDNIQKSSRSHVPVGSFDLESCHIDPAGKQDTKRKHVFIISTPKKVKLYIQTTSDSEFAAWLDAIMRELVARKENTNPDSEIMRLLKSLSIDENHMKVNRKMMGQQPEKGHWFTKNNTNNNNRNVKKVELKPTAYQQQQQLTAIGGKMRSSYNV